MSTVFIYGIKFCLMEMISVYFYQCLPWNTAEADSIIKHNTYRSKF